MIIVNLLITLMLCKGNVQRVTSVCLWMGFLAEFPDEITQGISRWHLLSNAQIKSLKESHEEFTGTTIQWSF